MKLIYVASPFSGDVEKNIEYAEQACRFVMDEGHAFFAPHLLYPRLLDDTCPEKRKAGIDMGLTVLARCDELWAFGERISTGMKQEMDAAQRLGVPVQRMELPEMEMAGPAPPCQEVRLC